MCLHPHCAKPISDSDFACKRHYFSLPMKHRMEIFIAKADKDETKLKTAIHNARLHYESRIPKEGNFDSRIENPS